MAWATAQPLLSQHLLESSASTSLEGLTVATPCDASVMWNISSIMLFTSALCLHTWHKQRSTMSTQDTLLAALSSQRPHPWWRPTIEVVPPAGAAAAGETSGDVKKDKRAHRENLVLLLQYSHPITFEHLTSFSHLHNMQIIPHTVQLLHTLQFKGRSQT